MLPTSHNAMRCTNWETQPRGSSQIERRSDDSANHSQHEDGGFLGKQFGADDFRSNSFWHTSINSHGTSKLHACGDQHGLFHCEGPRGHGCCKGICGIISTWVSVSILTSESRWGDLTNVPSSQEGKDGTDSKKIVILMEGRHGVRLSTGFNCL